MKARATGSHVDLFTGQKMTQVLKGRDDVNVQFFMPLAMHPLKPALEYLVFLAYRSEQDAKDLHTSLRAALSSEENDRLRCQFAQGYYAPLDVAPMPFDAEAGRQFGGDWLALASSDGVPSGILLCQVQGVDVHDRDSQSHRRKKSGGAVVSMRQRASPPKCGYGRWPRHHWFSTPLSTWTMAAGVQGFLMSWKNCTGKTGNVPHGARQPGYHLG